MTKKTEFSRQQTPTYWSHYICALAAVAVATFARFPIQRVMGNSSPFLFYFPVVLIIAFAFGLRPGLLATAASLLPADYFWMTPERMFSINLVQSCQMLAFSIAGCAVACLSEAIRRQKQLKERLWATFACLQAGIITTDCHGRIIDLNPMAEVMTELASPDAAGQLLGDAINLLNPNDHRRLEQDFQMALNDDVIEKLPKKVVLVSKTGRQRLVEQKVSRLLDAHGRRKGAVILLHS